MAEHIITATPDGATKALAADTFDAVARGEADAVDAWLDGGGSANATTEAGLTMLMGASLNGHGNLISRLIEKKADVNAQTGKGGTALMAAACMNDESMVKLLPSLVYF